MKPYFEFTQTAFNAKYCYTCNPVIDEREIHSYHEILYYIDGGATFICDGYSKNLAPNTLILIPKESYHFFKLDNAKSFERLKISFSYIDGFEELLRRNFSSIRIFSELCDSQKSLLDSLCRNLSDSTDKVKGRAVLTGSLLLLLSSLNMGEDEHPANERGNLVTDILEYVDKNLSSNLNTSAVASALGVSTSTVAHTFKSEMGISLHKYVTQKRIALATRMISDGKSPTKIYAECGFNDYSSFYKAFVRLTGCPPSTKSD